MLSLRNQKVIRQDYGDDLGSRVKAVVGKPVMVSREVFDPPLIHETYYLKQPACSFYSFT